MSESDFDDLFDDLEIRGTIEHTLAGVFVHSDRPLVLIMKHAGDANPAWKSARAKTVAERRAADGDDARMRAYNLRLYTQTVIVGWKNCNKKDGTPHPYTSTTAIALFERLIAKDGADKLGQAYMAAGDPGNFRGSTAEAADALGK